MIIGMTSRILTLPWKDITGNPSKLPNFESLARKYRFRAIGEYCRKFDISSLLLGHHADDQVETVVMRLAKGAMGAGLLGIKPSSPIPECEGIYGVHESGRAITLSQPPVIESNRRWQNIDGSPPDSGLFKPMPPLQVESGGITLYRPLLEFPKERLIATCESLGVKWFEDKTNHDPTLTDRNAIRHIYDSRRVPWALTKPRVLSLIAQLQDTENRRQAQVDRLIRQCKVTSFDTRRGTLAIGFPIIPSDLPGRKSIAAMLLRRIVMAITPNAVVSLNQVFGAVPAIFPMPDEVMPPKTFNAAGIMFQPFDVEQRFPDKNEWHIFRQPRYRSSLDEIVVPEITSTKETRWFLFDNRYWLLIHNELSSQAGKLVVRFLNKDDIPKLGRALGERGFWILKRLLKTVKSEDRWRYSLPIIVWRPNEHLIVGAEVVVALPTLDVKVNGFNRVRWLCRYKKINLFDLHQQAIVKPQDFTVRRLKKGLIRGPPFAPWPGQSEESLTGALWDEMDNYVS